MKPDYYEKMAKTFAIYPGAGQGTKAEFMYLALGLASEAGEVAGKIKKWYRDGTFSHEALIKELGDVLWYLSNLANAAGYSLDDMMELNVANLTARKEKGTISGSGDDR